MEILTLNCGSSSVKYRRYRGEKREILAQSVVERATVGGSYINHKPDLAGIIARAP